jgi:anaerobic magnesium-protoporphyrin IX monomethyl ester cyclase
VSSEAGRLDALLVRVNRQTIYTPSPFSEEQLGLLYVATAAERAGYRVAVIDEPGTTFARISNLIQKCGASVVGFYVDHENVFTAMSLMSMLKREHPRVLLVTGGPQSKEWHRRIISGSACDIATRGEGEQIFVGILDFFLRGRGSLHDVCGITWRDGPAIVVNREASPIDLDQVPIPNRALNPARTGGRGVESITTGRGCPFRCAFCYEGRPEAKYRKRSMDNIMAEVEHLIVDRKVRYLVVLDDVFLLNPRHAIEFAQRLKKLLRQYDWELNWFCEARADVICKHPEMLAECVDSGLFRVQVGVETGNQAVLDKYNKKLKVEETLKAVELCAKHDVLSVIGNFIIGGADETWETVEDSIELAEELLEVAPGRIDINSTIFTPYPGTPMYEYPGNFGIELLDPDCLTGPGDNYPFHRTKGLGKWEIVEARQRFLEAVDKKMHDVMPSIPMELAERKYSEVP